MTATFPTGVKSFSTKTDNVTTIYAVDVNDLQDEVTAIETTLGVNMGNIDIAANIHGSPNKTTPVGADEAGIWDSVTGLLNKVTWANIKATLKTYFDTLYLALVAPGTSGNVLTSNGLAWTSAAAAGGGGDWTTATGTWSYSSADAPTFIASVNADMTTTIYPGQRLSLTQTTEKFFIVTAVGAYSGGNTLITMYGGTDYTLASAAITSPKWSNVKVPSRFPMDPNKWTFSLSDTSTRGQATPTQNTWYNLGTLSANIPIGIWRVKYSLLPYGYCLGTANQVQLQISLSTSNNSVSDATLSAAEYAGVLASNAEFAVSLNKARPLSLVLAAKTTYYLIMRTISANIGNISFENASETLYLICECAYL